MMYVGVRHSPLQDKLYWFSVDGALVLQVMAGRKVLCDTKYGPKEGVIEAIISGVEESKVRELTGVRTPFKSVWGIYGTMNICDIEVPYEFFNSRPSPIKISARMEEYRRDGSFNTDVVVNQFHELVDGYTAYLVSKMFGMERLYVMFVAH